MAAPTDRTPILEPADRVARLTVTSRQYVDAFHVAVVYAHAGATEQAFEWLERAFVARSAMMVQLKVNPELDPLRSDARFEDLLRRMSFPR
jgi:hypothetical protein